MANRPMRNRLTSAAAALAAGLLIVGTQPLHAQEDDWWTPSDDSWMDVPDVGEGTCVGNCDGGYDYDSGDSYDYDSGYDSGYDTYDYGDSYDYDGGYDTYDYDYGDTYDYQYEEPYSAPVYEPSPYDLAVSAYNDGNALFDQGDYWGAEQKYREALGYDSALHDAWNNLGVALENQGRYQEALDAYSQAAALDPSEPLYSDNYWQLRDWLAEKESADTWNAGLEAMNAGNWTNAESVFRRMTELEPQNAGAFENLAYALHQQGRYGEATAADRAAFALDPGDPNLRQNLVYGIETYSRELATSGQPGQALELLREAADVARGDPDLEASVHDGLLAVHDSAPEDASGAAVRAEAARGLLALDAEDTGAHRMLGLAQLDGGDYAGAAETFAAALDLPSTTSEDAAAIHGLIGISLAGAGNTEGAYEAFRNGVALAPDDPLLHGSFADFLAAVGRNDEAAAEYRAALALDPGNANYAQALATLGTAPGSPERLQDALADLKGESQPQGAGEKGLPLEPFEWSKTEAPSSSAPPAAERGGEATAAGQLSGLGEFRKDKSLGTSVSAAGSASGEGAKGQAAIGFDTPGALGEGVDTSVVDGRAPEPTFETLPPELKTPEIQSLFTERDELDQQIATYQKQLDETPRTLSNATAIAEVKQKMSEVEQKKAYTSFSLNQKIDERKRELAETGGAGAPSAAAGTTGSKP